MSDNSFNQEDKDKFIKFLNYIAKHATFSMNTQDLIEYFRLLNHMQVSMLPKIDANILEVVRVIESDDESKIESKKGKK